MRPCLRPRSAAAGVAAALLLCGCELALHEVQQAASEGCDPWQVGCPAVVEYTDRRPVHPARIDVRRPEILSAALDAPCRPCDGVGLVCQGRIIGDVLWDQYVMVLAGESQSTSTAASAQRAVPGPEAQRGGPAAATAPQPATEPGRIVRTHGMRAGETATPR